MKIDKKLIKELTEYLDEFNLTELEYSNKDTRVKVSKVEISAPMQNIQTNNVKDENVSSKVSSEITLNLQLLESIFSA